MTDARAASPPLATHPHRTPVYAGEARTVPHFLESRITLPKYNPKPFGRKPVKIKTQNVQGIMFNGTNMEIGDFISRVEKAAQGSDICLQIVFFMQGEALAKEVQEMVELENYDWEKLKERGRISKRLMRRGNGERREAILEIRKSENQDRIPTLTCIARPIRIAVTKELIRDNQMQQAVNGSHIFPPYRTIMEYIGRERKTMSTLDIDDWLKEPQKAPASAP
ncbi:hypothetical protein Pst134EA_021119 [Puccinia striiformis f. sp. tritici]|uniref:hypothetical protein n=1 Tax=Puccinia striiformis f. sp. tritici TaxID=168172 RepID=UPI00200721CD|nr:hypothetical protein Pst134EA_021119 [Puccinia striiformis f. sp. tritici]KAH9457236.1 hypothetical protein Pst134EA_021119 [Puccinia striiformis f. sp. tritici]KAI9599658.1 hypothetical protein KEM48_008872 [Puccinia striiformis f. sp. tritici PST-130]